ncbi:MAG TPA: response regulator [Bdellovibrionales bacterium]|nr:response regulator [Bdellovibrionales bacterium]
MGQFVGEGPRRLLIVEADAELGETLATFFCERGYDVTRAATGLQAIELFRARPAGWDFLLTDYDMPGLNGSDLITWCRIWNIALKRAVLLTGGGDVRLKNREFVSDLGLVILRKPASLIELERVMA